MDLVLYVCCDLLLSIFVESKHPSYKARFVCMLCFGLGVTAIVAFVLFIQTSMAAAVIAIAIGAPLSLLLGYIAAKRPH